MRRRHIKHSFVGFPHEVTPLKEVFHKECDLNVDTEVLQIFSGLQKELIGDMMHGASALSQHRKSDSVDADDLLCYLDTQYNIDPLLVSEGFYQVEETTKKNNVPLPTEPLPSQGRKRCYSNTKKITKKISARKLKEIEKEKERVGRKRVLDICRQMVFKLPGPLNMFRKPENQLKAEAQTSKDIMSSPDIPECELKTEEQTSNDVLFPPDTSEFSRNKNKQSGFDSVPNISPVASTYKSYPKVEKKASIYDYLLKIQPSFKRPPLQDKDLVKLPGMKLKQEVSGVDDVLKQPPEAPICKPKSKVENKSLTCEHLIKVFPAKEKTELETQGIKIPSKNWNQHLPGVNSACVETSEVESQPSNKIPRLNSQVPKISGKKSKRNVLDVNSAPIETPEAARKRLAIILLRIAGKYQKVRRKENF